APGPGRSRRRSGGTGARATVEAGELLLRRSTLQSRDLLLHARRHAPRATSGSFAAAGTLSRGTSRRELPLQVRQRLRRLSSSGSELRSQVPHRLHTAETRGSLRDARHLRRRPASHLPLHRPAALPPLPPPPLPSPHQLLPQA